jgi:hypothetical protein
VTDYRKIFPASSRDFLRHDDLCGHPQVRRISAAEAREFTSKWGDEKAVVLTLEPVEGSPEIPSQLKCTRRLCKEIASALGQTDFTQWAGRDVELYPTEVDGYGKRHTVVGARAPKGGAA